MSTDDHSDNEEGITREILEDDRLRAIVRDQDPEAVIHDDPELRASIAGMLQNPPAGAHHGGGVWVFGYGSLIWNPCLCFVEHRIGHVIGFHRDLCLRETDGRGSPERPGLTLALAPGGSCRGMGFRIPAQSLDHELLLLWRREMVTDVYVPRWVTVRTNGGNVPAITFVVNRKHPAYVGRMDIMDAARAIRIGEGALGRSDAYVARTMEQLHSLGIRDRRLEHIAALARKV